MTSVEEKLQPALNGLQQQHMAGKARAVSHRPVGEQLVIHSELVVAIYDKNIGRIDICGFKLLASEVHFGIHRSKRCRCNSTEISFFAWRCTQCDIKENLLHHSCAVLCPPGPSHTQCHNITGNMLIQQLEDVTSRPNGFVVQSSDNITNCTVQHRAHASLFRWAVCNHGENNNPRDLQRIRNPIWGEGDAQKASRHKALLQNQLHILSHCVDRNSKSNACRCATCSEDSRVYANDTSSRIKERTARISWID
mmetsp:Transcript_68444/g.83933  ORF Transcript_68444/g.83933 Transcript_68444/m.83933 type:complete len:252 (-) Transcript_68444:83-838(-)